MARKSFYNKVSFIIKNYNFVIFNQKYLVFYLILIFIKLLKR